jgi:hypothetical protein
MPAAHSSRHSGTASHFFELRGAAVFLAAAFAGAAGFADAVLFFLLPGPSHTSGYARAAFAGLAALTVLAAEDFVSFFPNTSPFSGEPAAGLAPFVTLAVLSATVFFFLPGPSHESGYVIAVGSFDAGFVDFAVLFTAFVAVVFVAGPFDFSAMLALFY